MNSIPFNSIELKGQTRLRPIQESNYNSSFKYLFRNPQNE